MFQVCFVTLSHIKGCFVAGRHFLLHQYYYIIYQVYITDYHITIYHIIHQVFINDYHITVIVLFITYKLPILILLFIILFIRYVLPIILLLIIISFIRYILPIIIPILSYYLSGIYYRLFHYCNHIMYQLCNAESYSLNNC